MALKRMRSAGEAQRSGRLCGADWIEAGLVALAREGPNGLRIERLAKGVGASKGSFYWHFRDRAALEVAVLDAWDERTTTAILAQVASPEPGEVRLRRLGRLVTEAAEPGALLEIERAVRAWSVLDARVADRVGSVDSRRLAGVAALFRDCGFGRADAELRARIFAYYVAGEVISYPRLPLAKRRRLAQRRIDLLLGASTPSP
jgi:AcrR family transcriptional regulator